MSEDKLLKDLKIDFSKLNEDNKQYVLAILQALLFAQSVPRGDNLDKLK